MVIIAIIVIICIIDIISIIGIIVIIACQCLGRLPVNYRWNLLAWGLSTTGLQQAYSLCPSHSKCHWKIASCASGWYRDYSAPPVQLLFREHQAIAKKTLAMDAKCGLWASVRLDGPVACNEPGGGVVRTSWGGWIMEEVP